MLDLGLVLMMWELQRGWHDQPRSPRLEREVRAGPRRQGRFGARVRVWLARRLPVPGKRLREHAHAGIERAKLASRTGGGTVL